MLAEADAALRRGDLAMFQAKVNEARRILADQVARSGSADRAAEAVLAFVAQGRPTRETGAGFATPAADQCRPTADAA